MSKSHGCLNLKKVIDEIAARSPIDVKIDTTHTVAVDDAEAKKAIEDLKKDTESTHTIHVSDYPITGHPCIDCRDCRTSIF